MFDAWDLVGVFVASVSGSLAGRSKNMDWFGMFVIGLLTGLGGGTLRNLLLDLPILFLNDGRFILVRLAGTMIALVAGKWWEKYRRVVSVVDAFSLGVFVVGGLHVSDSQGLSWWACVMMGVITGAFGGVLRDVARAEIPVVFRKEIYASACIVGGVVWLLLRMTALPDEAVVAITALTTTGIRLLAIRYALNQSFF